MIAFEETVPQAKQKLQENDNLKTTKMKMDEIRQENNRLKLTLSQMIKDYNSLKDSVQDNEDRPKKSTDSSDMNDSNPININLSLGSHQYPERDDDSRNMNHEKKHQDSSCNNDDGLELGLDSKFTPKAEENPSPENSADRHVRSPKTSRNGEDDHAHELQSPLKKTRVSVRAVCAAQTMHDGCQWRKYGQKISKGNPCPRAYYRCTVSPTCPVRKQVQRCADNMSILTTTYEGTHDHPLPPSAASMASATSAAATMLSCGSSTTNSPVLELSSSSSHNNNNNNNANLIGLNFMSSSMIQRASISTTSQSHPTVILDLTKPNHSMMTSSAPFNNKLFSSSSSSLLLSNPNSSLSFSNPNSRDSSGKPFVYDKERENIMRDPTFQSALKAAITSIVGANYNEKLGENFHLSFSQPSFGNGSAGGVRNWSQLWNMS